MLRLLLVQDSAFPVGGFAFSHGVEWMTRTKRITDEAGLASFVAAYIDQSCARQSLPAALRAFRGTPSEVMRVDDLLDASMGAPGEREAGRLMGERFLLAVTDTFETGARVRALGDARRAGATPGQYAVAFGAFAADEGVPEAEALTALASGMALAVTQAAVRLNLIGQAAALRVSAAVTPALASTVEAVIASPRRRFGAFAPGLDVAALSHRHLSFRMFAS